MFKLIDDGFLALVLKALSIDVSRTLPALDEQGEPSDQSRVNLQNSFVWSLYPSEAVRHSDMLAARELKPYYKRLNQEYERDYLAFECPKNGADGCDCIRCLHAGNPKNLKSDLCYVDEYADRTWKALKDVAG